LHIRDAPGVESAFANLRRIVHQTYEPLVLQSGGANNPDPAPLRKATGGYDCAAPHVRKSVFASYPDGHRPQLAAIDTLVKNLDDAALLLKHFEQISQRICPCKIVLRYYVGRSLNEYVGLITFLKTAAAQHDGVAQKRVIQRLLRLHSFEQLLADLLQGKAPEVFNQVAGRRIQFVLAELRIYPDHAVPNSSGHRHRYHQYSQIRKLYELDVMEQLLRSQRGNHYADIVGQLRQQPAGSLHQAFRARERPIAQQSLVYPDSIRARNSGRYHQIIHV